MATGFMPYLLKHSKEVFMGANPSNKITPPGYLNYLLRNSSPNILSNNLNDADGHIRGIQVKYRNRGLESNVSGQDNCIIDVVPAYKEATVNTSYFSKIGVYLPDNTIAQYEKEASTTVAVGKPSTPMMNEVYQLILEQCQALFQKINGNLVTKLAANIGVNVVTASAAAQTVNFNLSGAVNNYAEGMTKVMSDVVVNEMKLDGLSAIGNGFLLSFMLQKQMGGMSTNQSGIDNSKFGVAAPNFFFDPKTTTILGANKFVVLEKDAFQLINVTRFKGAFGGQRGSSVLGTITLPVADSLGNSLLAYEFDFELRYFDCPTTTTVTEYGGSSNYVAPRGWSLFLMSSYDAFNIPSDGYGTTDRLYQNNGSLYFTATNV